MALKKKTKYINCNRLCTSYAKNVVKKIGSINYVVFNTENNLRTGICFNKNQQWDTDPVVYPVTQYRPIKLILFGFKYKCTSCFTHRNIRHENNYGESVTLRNLQSVINYILHQTMALVVIYGI